MNGSLEGVEELEEYIKRSPGLKDYFSETYVDFLLKKLDDAKKIDPGLLYHVSDKLTASANAIDAVIAEYISKEGIISQEVILNLANEQTTQYGGLSDNEQAEKIVDEIKQLIIYKIQSLTKDDESILIDYVKGLIAQIDQKEVSNNAKALAKKTIEGLFYTSGELDINAVQMAVDTFLKDPSVNNPGGNATVSPLSALDVALGILLIPIKILLLVPGVIINVILSGIASIGGQWDTITLERIFFNKINITNINIFKVEGMPGSIASIRTSIAGFYMAFRNLAIVLSLAVLVYIGIRMAISSIADEKAKYKQMLINWLVGFGLIFVLHYIIIITINANDMLVNALDTGKSFADDYMQKLLMQAWSLSFTTSFASIIMYSALLIMTFIFLIIYIKRMLTISFLVVIAPLISVTYSIDKIGNNRSEILDTWLKEFMYNVLIQPFHCLIYSVFIGTAMNLISEKGSLDFGAMTFAIILTSCIFLGQKIIREIFGFSNSKSLAEKVAIIALATKTVNNVKTIVAIKGAKNDLAAQRKVNKLPQTMANGEDTSLETMARMRIAAEQHRQEERQNSGGGNPTGQMQPTNAQTTTRANVKTRRRLKNAPRQAKRVARWYRDALATTSGYNLAKGIKNSRNKKRAYKMTEIDFFIAESETFRQSQSTPMTNEELAEKAKELYSKSDYTGLTAEETNFKTWIDHMKPEFGRGGRDAMEEMENIIKNGTTDNIRWRG